jgi:AcrR family transcriptional regulator
MTINNKCHILLFWYKAGLQIDMQYSQLKHEDILRDRIMDAAVACMQSKGVDKTRIGDIARELGIARQTVYNYFENKNALFESMFIREAVSLAERVSQHIEQFKKLDDKLVEAFLFAVREFPQSPILAHIITTGGQYLLEIGISRQTMQAFGQMALVNVFNEHAYLRQQSEEISELLSRNIISFLIMPDQQPRTPDQLEQFVRRRILPGIGLKHTSPITKVSP